MVPMARYDKKSMEKADEIIAREYATKTAYTVALIAGSVFSPRYISKRAHQLGYKPFKEKVEWTTYDAKYIKENYHNTTAVQLAKKFDVDLAAVLDFIERLGLISKQQRKKKKYDLRKMLGIARESYDEGLTSSWGADIHPPL